MITSRPGNVVLLVYPFTSAEGAKKRPALVLPDIGDDDAEARVASPEYLTYG